MSEFHMREPRLDITAAPHLHAPVSTSKIMWTVVYTLLPIIGVSAWFFGISALLVIGTTTIAAVATERLVGGRDPVRDGSAAITGILLGLVLPAGMPLWMAALGGSISILMGKALFGGLGQNVFNPALVGRAFLQAAFPTAITTWPAVGGGFFTLRGDNFALPLMSANAPDVVTQATPLGLMKFEHQATEAGALFFGNTGGSIGETSAALILLMGVFLAWKGYLNWRIPVSILLTTAVFTGVLHLAGATDYTPVFMLLSGGLMLGAVYMATDMVTSPVTNAGAWIFGAGIAFLVVLIRIWGGLPEGVMYAILLMNALVPFINQVTQPRVFGVARKAVAR